MRYVVLLMLVLSGCATSRYAKLDDSELKLRYAQVMDFLYAHQSGVVGYQDFRGRWHNSVQEKAAEKDRLETELFRRYRAGDRDAWLPIFAATGSPSTTSPAPHAQ